MVNDSLLSVNFGKIPDERLNEYQGMSLNEYQGMSIRE